VQVARDIFLRRHMRRSRSDFLIRDQINDFSLQQPRFHFHAQMHFFAFYFRPAILPHVASRFPNAFERNGRRFPRRVR